MQAKIPHKLSQITWILCACHYLLHYMNWTDTIDFNWKIMSALPWLEASCLAAIAWLRLPDTYQN